MKSVVQIACLPVGRGWEQEAKEQLNSKLKGLPDRFLVHHSSPTLEEVKILREVERISSKNPDILLLPAIHGGSARALVLAARKTGVPAALWCHNRDHSLASSSLAFEALQQLDHPCCLIHGDSQEATKSLLSAAAAASAIRRLSEARIGQLGPIHFNLIGTEVNPLTIHKRFGSWVVPLSISSIRDRLEKVDRKRCEDFIFNLKANYSINAGNEPLKKAAAIHLVLEEIAEEQELDIIALDCWNEILPEFKVSPCLGFLQDKYRIACEGDLILALSMISGEAICGKPGFTGDFYSFDEETGTAVLMHCGGYAELHAGPAKVEITAQPPPGPVSGGGTVLSCRPILPPGPGTVILLHGLNLDKMHLSRCRIEETDFSSQMQVRIHIEGDAALFRMQAAGNHYTVFPGDSFDAWYQWARWTGVSIH